MTSAPLIAWLLTAAAPGSSAAKGAPLVAVHGETLLLLDHAPAIAGRVAGRGSAEVSVDQAPREHTEILARPDGRTLAEAIGASLGVTVRAATTTQSRPVLVKLGRDLWANVRATPVALAAHGLHEQIAHELEVLGWSRDERYFVFAHTWTGTGGDPVQDARIITVLDLQTATASRFLVALTVGDLQRYAIDPDERRFMTEPSALCEGCGRARQWDEWRAAHPLAPVVRGNDAPKARLEVIARSGTVTRTDRFVWNPAGKRTCDATVAFEAVLRPSPNGPPATTRFPNLAGVICDDQVGRPAATTFSPHASESRRRIAWVITGARLAFDYAAHGVTFTAGAGPSVELAVHESMAAGTRHAIEQLTAASFTVTRVTSAVAKRERSVVYASQGFAAEAQRVAQAVPGGAAVEPLTWSAGADLVVALGRSALPTP